MIDLNKVTAGDTLICRNKGELIVHRIYRPEYNNIVRISCVGITMDIKYISNGKFVYGDIHPFDIVEIIPKPFDWSTVKHGMAFKETSSGGKSRVRWYLSKHIAKVQKDLIIVTRNVNNCIDHLSVVSKNSLVRCPERDVNE